MNEIPRRIVPASIEPMEPQSRMRPRPSGAFGVLDLGTTKIVCIIGRMESDFSIRVLGFGWQKGRGVRAGGISDIEDAERAIRAAVGQAEQARRRRTRHHRDLVEREHARQDHPADAEELVIVLDRGHG